MMAAESGVDAAFGWALIIAASFACYFGIPWLIGFTARAIRDARERDRLERERIQEDFDELARQRLLDILSHEQGKDEVADRAG